MSEPHGNPSDHNHTPAPLPEPKTPMWLPALGAVLFLAVGFIWGLLPDSKPEPGAPPDSPSAGTGDAGAPAARH